MASQKPVDADKVIAEQWEYIWEGRVPRGAITVVAGRGDQGKGLLAALITAWVTRQGGHVLFSAAEDDHKKMSKPRLEAAGADMSNVTLWRFSLPHDFDELEAMVKARKTQLIVIDPFAAHTTVSRRSDRVRSVLNPFTEMLEAHNVAALITEHALKKYDKHNPLGVIGGSSSGLPVATRAAFAFGRDPDDDTKRVLVRLKFNIKDEEEVAPLVFDLDTMDVPALNPKTGTMEPLPFPFLVFDEELETYDVSRLFIQKGETTMGRPATARAEATEWLSQYLADAKGPVLASKIVEDAKHANMNDRTLRRAAKDMGIVKTGGGSTTMWDLPPAAKKAMGIPDLPTTTDWDSALGELTQPPEADGD